MDDKIIGTVKKLLWDSDRTMIASHKRPDGDAVGSLLGLGLALQAVGKEIQMVLVDGVPGSFQHLAGSDQIIKRPKGTFDVNIVLDCSDLIRVGDLFEDGATPTINIDHHVTNLNFAKINIVNPEVPATSEILAELIPALEFSIGKEVAEALLTGIITDTLGFRTTNMHPKTFRVAADLMELGCDLPFLYQKALLNHSFKAIRFWGAGLNTLTKEERMVWATLTQEDRTAIGYPGRDDADLINVLSSIDGTDIVIVFVEQPNGSVKVSWRAHAGFDVSQIAISFGGGGHKPAAGAEIIGDLEFVKSAVLGATRNYLKNI